MKKSKKTTMIIVIACMFFFLAITPIVSSVAVIMSPLQAVGDWFSSIGSVFKSNDEKQDMIDFIRLSLTLSSTRTNLENIYEPYTKKDGVTIPSYYFIVIQFLGGFDVEEMKPSTIEIMQNSAIVSIKSEKIDENGNEIQVETAKLASTDVYVDQLLKDNFFRERFKATTSTIVSIIDAIGDLENIPSLPDDFILSSGEMNYPLSTWYPVTAEVGWYDPFNTGTVSKHEGIDLGAPIGTSILAISDATVIETSHNNPNGSRGYYVILDLGQGLTARYYHMVRQPLIKVGDTVKRGQTIGYVGTTGKSTGPHLHLEIRYEGVAINPRELIFFDKP